MGTAGVGAARGTRVAPVRCVNMHAINVPSDPPPLPDGWPKPPPLPEEEPVRRRPPPTPHKEEPEPPGIEPPRPGKPLPDYEEPQQFSARICS
jgi:hypothetical protein